MGMSFFVEIASVLTDGELPTVSWSRNVQILSSFASRLDSLRIHFDWEIKALGHARQIPGALRRLVPSFCRFATACRTNEPGNFAYRTRLRLYPRRQQRHTNGQRIQHQRGRERYAELDHTQHHAVESRERDASDHAGTPTACGLCRSIH